MQLGSPLRRRLPLEGDRATTLHPDTSLTHWHIRRRSSIGPVCIRDTPFRSSHHVQINPSTGTFSVICLTLFQPASAFSSFFRLSFLRIEKRRVGFCVLFSLLHLPHICHEDQVCLAAWDMNVDVECPSLCLRFSVAVRRKRHQVLLVDWLGVCCSSVVFPSRTFLLVLSARLAEPLIG